MKRNIWIIVALCVIVTSGIIFYIVRDGKYLLSKDITIQHEIYQKVNSGISYDDLIKFIDDKKIDYSLKDNKLSIDSMNFDIVDKENIKLENSGMIESFKKIDDKSSEANIKVSYNKDGERKEIISVNNIEYNGTNYFFYDVKIIIIVLSLLIVVVSVIIISLLKRK